MYKHVFELEDTFDFEGVAKDWSSGNYTIEEISEKYDISRDIFFAIKREAPHNWIKGSPCFWWTNLNEADDDLSQKAKESQKANRVKGDTKNKISREESKAANQWWNLENAMQEVINRNHVEADYSPPSLQLTVSKRETPDSGVLVINSQDYHLGCRPAREEMGAEEYADALIEGNKAVARQALKISDIERVYLVIGGDLLNVDNVQEQTTAGTPQDQMMNTSDVLVHAEDFTRDLTNLYRQVGDTVDLIHVKGNHDKILSQAVHQMLSAHFANEEDVVVDREYQQRQYRTWKDRLLCFTHGDYKRSVVKKLPSICTNEARPLISDTQYSNIHTGHLHYENVRVDMDGWVQQQAPAPTQLDEWHEDEGYVGSRQAIQGTIHYPDGRDHVITQTL